MESVTYTIREITEIEIKSELEIFSQPVVGYELQDEIDKYNDDQNDVQSGGPGEGNRELAAMNLEITDGLVDVNEDPLQCNNADEAHMAEVETKCNPFSSSSSTTTAISRGRSTSGWSYGGNEFTTESSGGDVSLIATESEPQVEKKITVKFETTVLTPHSETATDSSAATQTEKKTPKLKKFRPAICALCNMGFPTASLYEHHMSKVHQDERPYPCRHCKKPFAKSGERKVHERIHDPSRWEGEPQFACDICGKRYHRKDSMKLHRRKIHFGYKPPKRNGNAPLKEHHSTCGVKNPNPFRKPKQLFPCPQCDLKYDMRCNLKRHMLSHTKEKPFKCCVCQQAFSRQTDVKAHIRKVHEKSTPTGMHHPRPKWQAGQPCPCDICPKVFKTPSQLRNHMYLHTGQKPHKCLSCGECFRMAQTLNHHIRRYHRPDIASNPFKLYKCMICGKENFRLFNALRQHRVKAHGHLPYESYESEKEKPFGCVVCSRPFFLREDAIICALLGHDPSSLLHDMFRFKCPECPPETFGFHNLSVLRRHWQAEHSDKFLPVHFRKGMNFPNLKEDELPNCRRNKAVVQNWKQCGIPPELLLSDDPLFTELPLLPISEENRFKKRGGWKWRKEKKLKEKKSFECELCGLTLSKKWNLKKHVEVVHNPSRMNAMPKEKDLLHSLKRPLNSYKCRHCAQKFRKMKTLRLHERKHLSSAENKTRGRGRPPKIQLKLKSDIDVHDSNINIKQEPIVSVDNNEKVFGEPSSLDTETKSLIVKPAVFPCKFCHRTFTQIRAVSMHEKRAHVRSWSTKTALLPSSISSSSKHCVTKVNVNDETAVAKALNGKELRILLTRCNHQIIKRVDISEEKSSLGENKTALNKWSSMLGNRIVKIVLEKVDN